MAKPTRSPDFLPVWPLRLTRLGMFCEEGVRGFWPLWSLALLAPALLLLGGAELLPVRVLQGGALIWLVAICLSLFYGIRRFSWPSRADAQARLDATLPGRPLQAVLDRQMIGGDDPSSQALWQAHQARMVTRLAGARRVRPDLQLARFDPFALRYTALLLLLCGVVFGSFARLSEAPQLARNGPGPAAGPSWEGWVEPPGYTGLPTVYLADQTGPLLRMAEGSRIILRFYGEVGALELTESLSGTVAPVANPAAEQSFVARQNGGLAIAGPGGRSWQVEVLPDLAPSVRVSGPAKASFEGQMNVGFEAEDDYGITAGSATITLDLASVDRRHGLQLAPEPQEDILRDLPLPIAGSRAEFSETLIDDFSKHPWAHLPVQLELRVQDAAGQEGQASPQPMVLPARQFFDPLASAIVEQRRDLLWNRDNAPRVAQVLRAISWKPEERLFRDEGSYLQFRTILRRLEAAPTPLSDVVLEELTEALWALALQLEEGDLDDALERMQRAQERLTEAMRKGASEEEIAELMQELRDATQDYLRQLSRQAQQDQQESQEFSENQNSMQMDMNDLQEMMDRIQELMEQGRMAEAQQALEELQQLLENMQVTQGGDSQNSPGDQAMEELGETLRQQQGLSDQAFRDLQEQFNPGANQGQSQNNEGRNGGDGRGQSHEGQNGQGQDGQGQGEESGQSEGDMQQGLAQRQRALRDELSRQRGSLPGAGTEQGDAAREALRRAERAMEGAEQSLRENDLPGAIDRQAEAMDQLREGMRNLGEALAEAQRQQQEGQGQADGQTQAGQRDPLGRNPGSGGALGGDENLLQGEDVYRRARELLEEIRRRSGDGSRSQEELDYLKRLLDRF